MKVLRYITIAFTVLMIAGLIYFFSISNKITYEENDLVYYNEQLHKIVEEYKAGSSETEIEDRYGCFVILSTEISDTELAPLYRSGALVMDLVSDGEYIGKVAWNNDRDRFRDLKTGALKAAMVLWITVLISGYILLFIIYRDLIKPIDEMDKISGEIAKGNLDVAIPMRKHNIFGSFTEAFDIMREELKASRKREMEAEIARKELIASLSHDIKTPLAVIKATCDVLELKLKRNLNSNPVEGIINNVSEIIGVSDRTNELKDSLKKIEVISGKTDSITTIMNDMMHANMEDLEKIEVCPTEENSQLLESFFTGLHDYGRIIVKNDVPPCLVYMDKQRMEQVIDNIIGNSYKYAGTDIEVSFDETSDVEMADGTKNRFIRIRISDHGPGVSEEDLPLIAEKYYRGSNVREKNGFGLGLYLVRCYMEKQGGGMDYYNDNGFTVELLLKKV